MDETNGSIVDVGKLAHELANHMFVISMGVELLEAARDDPERFAEALESIRRDGLDPMIALIESLPSRATEP